MFDCVLFAIGCFTWPNLMFLMGHKISNFLELSHGTMSFFQYVGGYDHCHVIFQNYKYQCHCRQKDLDLELRRHTIWALIHFLIEQIVTR